MRNKSPKIVIIGAGSLFFGRQAIWAANNLPGLKGCTLSLVDTDPEHLDQMTRLARAVAQETNSGTRVEASSDFRQALPGADFVVISFSHRNAHYRGIDCAISAKYGIRMCSGDTIGPGGVFRALREFPKILHICRAIEEICPEAWVINYVNPSAVMGIGVMRHSTVKSFALCDSHHLPGKKESYLKLLDEPISKIDRFDLRIAGVNHFTFMLKAELEGRDVMPEIGAAFRKLSADETDAGHSKARFNNFITAQLGEVFGAYPTCTGHSKEYVPYYQGLAAVAEPIPALTIFDAKGRDEETARFWQDVHDYNKGVKPISEFLAKTKTDHATDIINTMVAEDGRNYFVNRTNSDCTDGGGRPVGNLPEDAFLELECRLDRNGPKPVPVGNFPLGLRAQQYLILDVHELTIEAIVKRDRGLLLRCLAMDPLVNSIATADAVIEDLYEAEKESLPKWVKKTTPVEGASERVEAEEKSAVFAPQLF